MNLTIIEKKTLDGLSPNFKALVSARLQSPFKTLPKPKQTEICHNAVTLLHTKTGDKGSTSPETIAYQTQDFAKEMVGRFSEFTEQEVYMACENLYRGEYGQFFGLNAKTYHQLLKGFCDNPDRGKAWLKYLEELDKPKILEIPEHIKIDLTKKGLINRFEHYKKTKDIGFTPWLAYDEIKKFKKTQSLIDKVQFVSILKMIEPEFEMMLKKEKLKAERDGDNGHAEALGRILVEGVVNYKPCQQRLKERALKIYFDNIQVLEL